MSEKKSDFDSIVVKYISSDKTFHLTAKDLFKKKPTDPIEKDKELSCECLGCKGLMPIKVFNYQCHVCGFINQNIDILSYKCLQCGFEPNLFQCPFCGLDYNAEVFMFTFEDRYWVADPTDLLNFGAKLGEAKCLDKSQKYFSKAIGRTLDLEKVSADSNLFRIRFMAYYGLIHSELQKSEFSPPELLPTETLLTLCEWYEGCLHSYNAKVLSIEDKEALGDVSDVFDAFEYVKDELRKRGSLQE